MRIRTIKKLLCSLIAVASVAGIFPAAPAMAEGEVKQVFVEPGQSIEAAMKSAEGLKSSMASGRVEVVLKEGIHRITEQLKITPSFSGTETVKMAIVGEAGKKVVLTRSIGLPNEKFEKVSDSKVLEKIPEGARGNVYAVNLKALGVKDYGHVGDTEDDKDGFKFFEDDTWATLAKYPNNDEALVGGVGRAKFGEITMNDNDSKKYEFETVDIEPERLKNWSNAEDAKVFLNAELGYTTHHLNLINTNPDRGTVLMGGETLSFTANGYWFIENLIEELDSPGEYYLDRETGILYTYPRGDVKTAKFAYHATSDEKGHRNGSDGIISYKADGNVVIENLYIENSVGNGVDIAGNGLEIRNCRIQNVAIGVSGYGVYNNKIIGNTICNTAINTMWLTGGDVTNLIPSGNEVTNNHIYKGCQDNRTLGGVTLEGVGNTLTHNLIHDMPHDGMRAFGVEAYIAYNEMYDVCQDNLDAGLSYSGRSFYGAYGGVMEYNYFHDSSNWAGGVTVGIYNDDMLSGGTIRYNVIERTPGGIALCGGRDFTAYNNIMINGMPMSNYAVKSDTRGQSSHAHLIPGMLELAEKNGVPTSKAWAEKYPECVDNFTGDDYIGNPDNQTAVNNISSNWSKVDWPNEFPEESVKRGKFENNHRIDEVFSHRYNSEGIIEFTNESEFTDLGCEWIDTSEIGLLGDGNYDIPKERHVKMGQGVQILTDNADKEIPVVEYPERAVDLTDLLKDKSKLNITGNLTNEGDVYKLEKGKVGYSAEKIDDIVLRFRYRTNDDGAFNLYLRGEKEIDDCWLGNASYNLWFKPDALEFQRWNPGNAMLENVTDVTWKPSGQWNNCEVVIQNLSNGDVGIYASINGTRISHIEDGEAVKRTKAGYIHIGSPDTVTEFAPYDASLNTGTSKYTDINNERKPSTKPDKTDEPIIDTGETPIEINIDGRVLDSDVAPYIKNGRTYVPVRAIFESLGARVEYNAESYSVTAFKDAKRMYMGIGDTYAVLDGTRLETDSPAEITNERTMVGVRFVSEMFGCTVDWDGENRVVNIRTEDYAAPETPDDKDDEPDDEDTTPSSIKYDDLGNFLLYHKVPKTIFYESDEAIPDGLLDGTSDVESKIKMTDKKENYYLRDGLRNVINKLNDQKSRKLNVVFLGGSITQQLGYRDLTQDWLNKNFPDRFNFVNAGYGGTGSSKAAQRADRDVIAYDPDLVFVEFAVNDQEVDAESIIKNMESVVRQILTHNSTAQIVFVYTVSLGIEDKVSDASKGLWSREARIMDYVAEHYGIPSVFVATEAAKDIADGKALGKKSDVNDRNTDLPIYSNDGTHPTEEGSEKFFNAMEPMLNDLLLNRDIQFTEFAYGDRGLHPYLYKDSCGDRESFTLEKYIDGTGFTEVDARTFKNSYKSIDTLYESKTAGDSVTFEFYGTKAGVSVLAGPDVGRIDIYVDGELVKSDDIFHQIFTVGEPNNMIVETPLLENGKHTVSFKISEQLADKMKLLEGSQYYDSFKDNTEALNSHLIVFQSGWVNGKLAK